MSEIWEMIEMENGKMDEVDLEIAKALFSEDEFEEFMKERREAERKTARRMKLKKIAMWVAGGIVVAVFLGYQSRDVDVGVIGWGIFGVVAVAGLCWLAYECGREDGFKKGHIEGKMEMRDAFLEVEEIKAIYDGWFEDVEEEVVQDEGK